MKYSGPYFWPRCKPQLPQWKSNIAPILSISSTNNNAFVAISVNSFVLFCILAYEFQLCLEKWHWHVLHGLPHSTLPWEGLHHLGRINPKDELSICRSPVLLSYDQTPQKHDISVSVLRTWRANVSMLNWHVKMLLKNRFVFLSESMFKHMSDSQTRLDVFFFSHQCYFCTQSCRTEGRK